MQASLLNSSHCRSSAIPADGEMLVLIEPVYSSYMKIKTGPGAMCAVNAMSAVNAMCAVNDKCMSYRIECVEFD